MRAPKTMDQTNPIIRRPKNLRLFRVRYLGPTDRKGSRIKIIDTRNNISRVFQIDHSFDGILEQAYLWLVKKGIVCEHMACPEDEKGYVLLSNDFSTSIQD